MKFLQPALFTAMMLLAGTGTAMASSASLNEFTPKVLPVLVQINAKGKVTDASPAMKLSPRLDRLLRQNLDELINQPATDHGRPVASQFVANLALTVTPRREGGYDARFAFVSGSPVPSGSWHWVHVDGHRLALARQDAFDRGVRLHHAHDMNRRGNHPAQRPEPSPSIRSTTTVARDLPMGTPGRGH